MLDSNVLKERRDRLAIEIAKLDELLAAIHSYASEFAPDLLTDHGSTKRPAATGHPTSRRPSRHGTSRKSSVILDMTADVAGKAMDAANAPLPLAALEKALEAAGVPMPESANPRNVIGTRMSRCGRYHSIPGIGWWFNDRPLPTNASMPVSGTGNDSERPAAVDDLQ